MPNPEPDPNAEIEKTAHLNFHITGSDVDKIDWLAVIHDQLGDFEFTVTSGNVNIYYSSRGKHGTKA